MGQARALALMMSLALLTACGGGGQGSGEDLALSVRRDLSAMTGCSFQVAFTADYETRAFDYVLDVTWDSAMGATLTIVEPALAQGVAAHIQNGRSELVYDDFCLDAGPLTGDGLSPLETVPVFYRLLTRGDLAGAETAGETVELTCRDGENPPGVGLEAAVVFDARTRAPLTGELFADGRRIVTAQVRDFQSMTAAAGGAD